MADDRSLKDVIRFLDPTGSMTDADIAAVSTKLKFTEVLDLITQVGKDDLSTARNMLAKYDDRFTTAAEESITNEYSSVPTTKPTTSTFKPIKPAYSGPASTTNGQQNDEEDVNAILDDPTKQNDPNVRQIKNLLQRMQR